MIIDFAPEGSINMGTRWLSSLLGRRWHPGMWESTLAPAGCWCGKGWKSGGCRYRRRPARHF